jgi:hypothetical protein
VVTIDHFVRMARHACKLPGRVVANRSGSDGGSGLSRVGWSRVAWFQATGGGVRSSYSTGLSMPRAECLRCRLWKISRYSKSAVDSSSRVLHRLRLSSSTWTRAQKDSIIALSTQSPMEPIEGSRPEALARCVNAQDPNCTP